MPENQKYNGASPPQQEYGVYSPQQFSPAPENGAQSPLMGDKKVFSRIGFGMLVFMALSQILVVVISMVVGTVAPQITQTGWYLWVLSYAPLYLVCFPVLLCILKGIPDAEPNRPVVRRRISLWKMIVLVVACLGVVFILNLFSTLLASLVALLKGGAVVNPLGEMAMNSGTLVNLLFVSLVAPIMEEIIFRRLLYKKLAPYGGKVYVLFSAFVFALFHANLYQLFYAFVLGAVIAYVYLYTGNIGYAIALHLCINFLGNGVPTLLMGYATQTAVEIWSYIYLGLCIVGLVAALVWLGAHRKTITFEPGARALARKSEMLLNPGMICYMVLILLLIVFTLLMPAGAI